jgi:hypothetical protein
MLVSRAAQDNKATEQDVTAVHRPNVRASFVQNVSLPHENIDFFFF